MFWFILFQLLGLIALVTALIFYCRFKKLKFFPFIYQHVKHILIALVAIIVLITLICWKPLYHTTECFFRGTSMRAETKYSWYLGECQIKTRTGSYLPLNRSRGMPEGNENNGHNDLLY